MSAIAGVWRLDGQPVDARDLDAMASALRQHGPDRSGALLDGSIGLLHLMMIMTPEDEFDQQPWRGEGGAVIAADLRLDDRDNLLARMHIAPQAASAWPDSRILLAAWQRFGDAIWPTLRGAFAAAIWDPQARSLTLARDHFGHRVLMWHRSSRSFAFATMPSGLFALDDVPRNLNEEKFADFLVLNHNDQATTVWRDVHRIPPAHVMQVFADGSMTVRRYWSVSDVPLIRLRSDEAICGGTSRLPRTRGPPPASQRAPGRLFSQRWSRFLVGRGIGRSGAGRPSAVGRFYACAPQRL
jgi:asparagine synthase (glutamine-hydrolysing)